MKRICPNFPRNVSRLRFPLSWNPNHRLMGLKQQAADPAAEPKKRRRVGFSTVGESISNSVYAHFVFWRTFILS